MTHYLNLAGAVALPLLAWDVAVAGAIRSRRRWRGGLPGSAWG